MISCSSFSRPLPQPLLLGFDTKNNIADVWSSKTKETFFLSFEKHQVKFGSHPPSPLHISSKAGKEHFSSVWTNRKEEGGGRQPKARRLQAWIPSERELWGEAGKLFPTLMAVGVGYFYILCAKSVFRQPCQINASSAQPACTWACPSSFSTRSGSNADLRFAQELVLYTTAKLTPLLSGILPLWK